MRWIWIDRFLDFQSGKSARAVKNLSLAEDYFADHFPGYPVMPACFILEGVAQTGGILVGEANNFQEKVILAKIVSARFRREVLAKYFAEPERYSVSDGQLTCLSLWSCQIDNDLPSHVVVFLGDLGRDLPYEERLHWRQFNVSPEGGVRETNFRRSFSGSVYGCAGA